MTNKIIVFKGFENSCSKTRLQQIFHELKSFKIIFSVKLKKLHRSGRCLFWENLIENFYLKIITHQDFINATARTKYLYYENTARA